MKIIKQQTIYILLFFVAIIHLFSSCKKTQLRPADIIDTIPYIAVCDQLWMAKNLDVVTYRNGDTIPQITSPALWGFPDQVGAWCYYNNDSATGAIYGKLYNWAAVNDPRGLAPEGWHIPTDAEWDILTDTCLGSSILAAPKLKEAGYEHWEISPIHIPPGNNNSGLTFLPGGRRSGHGMFEELGRWGNWWSSTPDISSGPLYRYLRTYDDKVGRGSISPYYGFSVRCIKDK